MLPSAYKSEPDVQVTFRRSQAAIDLLRSCIPEILKLYKQDRPDLPGWQALAGGPTTFIEIENKPVLVAALVGPSGAGKSTLFTLLTGLDVPAGDAIRPMTYNSLVGIPNAALEDNKLAELFPGFRHYTRLTDKEQLKDRTVSGDQIFYHGYNQHSRARELWLYLADIPDFNTVERNNWDKAERMLDRADVVLFTVYPEGYKDQKVISILHRCCTHAGHLACLFTKVGRENAKAIWEDLIAYTETQPAFQELRHDGRTLAAFLAESRVFCSRRTRKPKLRKFLPLKKDEGRLEAMLRGLDGADILLERRLQTIREGVQSCRQLCEQAQADIHKQEYAIDSIETSLKDAAAQIAGTEFPIGRMVELIVETARNSRPAWLRVVSSPLNLIARAGRGVVSAVSIAVSHLTNQEVRSELRNRQELETERLATVSEQLLDHWRTELPDLIPSCLSKDRCREQAAAFKAFPPPTVQDEWDDYVRDNVRRWMHEHPWRSHAVGALDDFLVALGGGAVAVDFFVAGGLGTIGIITAAGSGSVLAGVILKLFETAGLRGQLKLADKKWCEQRSREILLHLRSRLAGPVLLDSLSEQLNEFRSAPIEDSLEACSQLEDLEKELHSEH